ncbi:glycoside hydrolase family 9 protein [Xanthocytophaga agilis]|uniref:Glycoside hydrolase family 9 protein n=1 Tax=Xanthocytophaga agilis TaxID=3048010 RepID=A0AAE3UCR2_9BACT|nr:glycoside hydrolase family 9 protein [Xanthocytophaga agilis]MDJ1500370.1 glycoside hydrolase family 9 protein [Xanthocytophaga agilis]
MKSLLSLTTCSILLSIFGLQSLYAQYNYAEGLQKTLLFYEAQRSGKMPANNRLSWRGDSHLRDGKDVGIDLTGGWYDAGDSPKWNATMSFAASTLAWSALEYPKGYQQSGQISYLLNNLKWVGDYFIKCLRFKTINDLPTYRVFVEVGNVDEEHKSWVANEVMQALYPNRPSFYADKDAPATSIVAAMAASQAVSSIVFRTNGNTQYADALLLNAQKLYEFATTYQGNGTVKNARGEIVKHTENYDENRFEDQVCLAAIWLYRATKSLQPEASAQYLKQAEKLAGGFANRVPEAYYSYSTYEIPCFILLSEEFPDNILYKQKTEAALDRFVNLPKSPGGLAKIGYEWGTLRHANNTAWLFFVYADHLAEGARKTKYEQWAKSQLDYSLGSNPQNRSYLLGFQPAGKTVVNTPHHGTAHAPWAGWEHLNKEKPEFRYQPRHILYGGLLGGPNWNDEFKAEVGNAAQTEVALDFNAGITANMARMTSVIGGKPLPNFPPKEKPDDEYFVEASIADTDNESVEIKAWLNNRSAFPAKVSSNLSFRYYFQAEPGTQIQAEIVNGKGAAISQPTLYQGSIYFVTVTFPNIPIFPGGLDPNNGWTPFYRKEVVFRLKSSGSWNNANDWSFKGITTQGKSPVKVNQISVWEGKKKLGGIDPPKG